MMAKKATSGAAGAKRASKPKSAPRKAVRVTGSGESKGGGSSRRAAGNSDSTITDALFKLLESPLVAELLAVGATAALAAITESRYSRKTGADAKSSKVVKAAGKAAAAAIGRRLTTEFGEIRKASRKSTESAEG
jgi:hypothetical protein